MSKKLQKAKATLFRDMHRGAEILVLANAWDSGTAKVLASAGCKAIGTTSAGIAFAHGLPDAQVISRKAMMTAIAKIAAAVAIPVSADIEAGYGPSPADLAETVRLAIKAGAIGGNIEDSTGQADQPLFTLAASVERIKAARAAAEATGIPFVINARTDIYAVPGLSTEARFDVAVQRANAYRAAGADCLFVPFINDLDLIGRLARSIDGPLNVVVGGPGMPSVRQLQSVGVARLSIGGSLARASFGLVRRAARELLQAGTFGYIEGAIPHGEINSLFG